MGKLFDQAFEAAQTAPSEMQDAVAPLTLDINDGDETEAIPDEHLAAVLEGEAQADRGEFATDDQVAGALRRFDG